MTRSALAGPQVDLSDLRAALPAVEGVDAIGAVPVSILSDRALQAVVRWAVEREARPDADEAREARALAVACRVELADRISGRRSSARFRLEDDNVGHIAAVRIPHPQVELWSAGVVEAGSLLLAASVRGATYDEAKRRAEIVRDALNALAVIP